MPRSICAAGIALIAMHLAAIFTDSPLIWGIDSWRYLQQPIPIALAVLAGMAWIPGVAKYCTALIDLAGSFLFRALRPVPSWAWYGLIGLAGAWIFWTFQTATHFLGDGYIRMRTIERGLQITGRAPLDEIVHAALYHYGHAMFGWDVRTVFGIVSVACGVGYLWCTAWISQWLAPTLRGRLVVSIILCASGSILLFFGYVESYSLLYLFIFSFFGAVLSMLHGQGHPAVAALLLGLSIATHPISLMFVPAALYVFIRHSRYSRSWQNVVKTFIAFLLAPGSIVVYFLHRGTGLKPFLQTSTGPSHWLPLGAPESTYYVAYSIWSSLHLLDLLNIFLLLSPAVVFYLAGFLRSECPCTHRGKEVHNFLYIAAGAALLYLSLFNMEKGYARDWDLAAIAGIPLTFLAATGLCRLVQSRPLLAVPIVVTLATITIPWIAINASEHLSVDRFEILARSRHWPDRARADAFDELRVYHSSKGNQQQALIYAGKTVEAAPHNARYLKNLASNLLRLEKYADALSLLHLGTQLFSGDAQMHVLLAFAYGAQGKQDSAMTALLTGFTLDPAILVPNLNLATSLYKTGFYNYALLMAGELTRTDPENRLARELLIELLVKTNQTDSALTELQKLVDRYPENPDYRRSLQQLQHVLSNPVDPTLSLP